MPCTVAGLRHAAISFKRRRSAADKYPVSRRVSRRSLATLASLVAALALPASASASLVTEFSTGLTLTNAPADIATGPDGKLWFTEQGLLPGVGSIDPATGDIDEFSTGLLNVPGDIVGGTDGGVWFTIAGANESVARIDPGTGDIVTHSVPSGSNVTGLDVDADGNLWYGAADKGKLGRMAPDGQVTEFDADLSGDEMLKDVAVGPDGWIWYTVEHDGGVAKTRTSSLHSISRVNPADGDICHFSEGLTGAPNKIVAASDGKLYFTESGDPAAIGRVKTDGTIKEFSTGLTADSGPVGIAEGGDKALWFTAAASPGRIGRMVTKNHQFTEFAGGTAGLGLLADADPAGITRGPDGNIWFTESGLDGRIARMLVPPVAGLDLTQAPDLIGRDTVTNGQIEATVAANTQDTSYHVEYGTDSNYGSQTNDVTVPASAGAEPVTDLVQLDLEPSSHYYARLVATNLAGEAVSSALELWTDENGKLLDFAPEVPEIELPPTLNPTPGTKPSTSTPGSTSSTEPSTTTPLADAPIAPPVLGKAVVVHPLSGSIRVKAPGARTYSPLAAGANLPVGTLVDARAGKIVLQSARNARGRTQNGTFWGGVFQIRQGRKSKGMTDLHLRGGGFGRCGTRAGTSVLAHESGGKRRVVRRLWGKDKHSRFRTHGRDSVATVRGTKWVTTDRCDGTQTLVTQGKVLVRDLHRKRSVMVRAGHAYLARHRHHR